MFLTYKNRPRRCIFARSSSFLLAVTMGPCCSKTCATQIETFEPIRAPPHVVMRAVADFPSRNAWDRSFHIEGTGGVGTRLKVEIPNVREHQSTESPMTFTPLVLVNNDDEIRWRGELCCRGCFDGEHYFRAKPQGDGTTLLHHGEVFTGAMMCMMKPCAGCVLVKKTEANFRRFNDLCRQHCEGMQ